MLTRASTLRPRDVWAIDLAEMVSEKEAPKMTCEFCGKIYHITESEVAAAYHSKVKKVDN